MRLHKFFDQSWKFATAILIGIVVVRLFLFLDDAFSSKDQYAVDGELIAVFERAYASKYGNKIRQLYTFVTENRKEATISLPVLIRSNPQQYPKGARAALYYHKGFFSKRPIYDRFEFYERQ